MRKRLSKKNNTQKGGFVGCNDVPVVNESGISVSGHSGYNIDSLSIPGKKQVLVLMIFQDVKIKQIIHK